MSFEHPNFAITSNFGVKKKGVTDSYISRFDLYPSFLSLLNFTLDILIRMNMHLARLGISNELIAARGLQECEEATRLEVAEVGADGREHLLAPSASAAWCSLKAAALVDGVDLFIVSAFRSIDRQAEIIRQKIEAGVAIENILAVCAPPGYSEHHTGRAIDLSTPGCRALEVEFDQTIAYAWLNKHAAEFGYYLSYPIGNSWGYQYEPWHWCHQDAQLERVASSSPSAVKNG